MAYYDSQNPRAGDDFMSFNSGTTGPSHMGADPNYMNPHDSQQSYSTNFLDMGDQGSHNSGYQDRNQGYNPPDSTYASSGVDPSFAEAAPGYGQQSYGGDSSFIGGHPSTQDQQSTHSKGDSSFLGGYPSTHDGVASFVRGHPSTQGGDSSFVGGHPSTHDGDSSFVGGHPSTQEGDSSFVVGHPSTQDGESSFVGGHPSTGGRYSPSGVPAPENNAFDSSVDGRGGSNTSSLQVEVLTERISQETNGRVDGFAATLRILAELARREQTFTRGQRFAWRFITLAEAAEAGGDRSSAALRDAGEPTQNSVLVEVHGMLGGRGSNIAQHLEGFERDARLDASDDWGIDSPVNALTESQGIAFDQVELNRRGPIPTLADGLRRLGTPVRRGGAQPALTQPHAGTSQGAQASTSTQGDSTLARAPPAGRGGRGPSPSPRGGGASRGRGGSGRPVFQSTGKQGI